MNYCIEGSEMIDLIGNVSCLSDTGEVPNRYRLCFGKFLVSLIHPLLVSSMQCNAVALVNQKLRGHEA